MKEEREQEEVRMDLGGIHHAATVTADASANLGFYVGILGLRLVKKTVIEGEVPSYHLFYGDELGRPGTVLTVFEAPGADRGLLGAGMISGVAFRVPGRGALEWWAGHLDELGVAVNEVEDREDLEGAAALAFADPEGLRLELVEDGSAGRAADALRVTGGIPWQRSRVPAGVAIRGLRSTTLAVGEVLSTATVLTEALGFRRVGDYAKEGPGGDPIRVAVFEAGPGGPGTEVRLEEWPDVRRRGRAGVGTGHHLAFRAKDDTDLVRWQRRLRRLGAGTTEIIDRRYFRSIYFREPGGVLLEVATDGPGFTRDEEAEHLGERLSLPRGLEPHRGQIEAVLGPISSVGGVAPQ